MSVSLTSQYFEMQVKNVILEVNITEMVVLNLGEKNSSFAEPRSRNFDLTTFS